MSVQIVGPENTRGDHSVVVLPHAGGSPGEYIRLFNKIDAVTGHIVRYPGREGRGRPAESWQDLISSVVNAALPENFWLFGHSMGARLAFDVAEALSSTRVKGVLMSAPPAPTQVSFDMSNIQSLGDRSLTKLGSRSRLAQQAAAALQTDLELLASAAPAPACLDLPLTILRPTDDPSAEHVVEWKQRSRRVDIREVQGGHFYFREDPTELIALINEVIDNE